MKRDLLCVFLSMKIGKQKIPVYLHAVIIVCASIFDRKLKGNMLKTLDEVFDIPTYYIAHKNNATFIDVRSHTINNRNDM